MLARPKLPPLVVGFCDNAERINTRACIVGLVSLFVLEGLFGRPFLELIGISIGHGLGFEI
eukprot:PRCOL_00006531-RA